MSDQNQTGLPTSADLEGFKRVIRDPGPISLTGREIENLVAAIFNMQTALFKVQKALYFVKLGKDLQEPTAESVEATKDSLAAAKMLLDSLDEKGLALIAKENAG